MRAIVYRQYGGPEVLERAELSQPIPGAGQVLVKVHATSINAADYRMMRADPFLVRAFNGWLRPQWRQVLGMDVAGVVAAVGPGVTKFAVGDAVFGETPMRGQGAFAEYALGNVTALARKPERLRFEEAAAVPLAAMTALQGLRDLGKVGPGSKVVVQGAGGGVGIFAVQLARHLGAEVTAVCGPKSAELVRSLGAAHVVDYTQRDFTAEGKTYDVIVAVNGYHSLLAYRRCLVPGGRYVMIGGTGAQLFQTLLFARLVFGLQGKWGGALTIDESKREADVAQLASWLEAGAIRPVIDRELELEQAAEAMRYVEAGHVRGKVVLRVAGT